MFLGIGGGVWTVQTKPEVSLDIITWNAESFHVELSQTIPSLSRTAEVRDMFSIDSQEDSRTLACGREVIQKKKRESGEGFPGFPRGLPPRKWRGAP